MSQQLRYFWFREFGGHQDTYIKTQIERGSIIIELEGQKKNTTFMAQTGFSSGKTDQGKTGMASWNFEFVQDGECFTGTVPWSIKEKDIAKCFDMEKVPIQ